MLENFFQIGSLPSNIMIGSYDLRLVILSYLVATFASYIALDITGRLRDFSNTQMSTMLWIIGGAIAMGAGIWSMHFIGMLAFNLPMPMLYDPVLTILSMAVAISASAFALMVLKARVIHFENILLGGVILGLAIAAMHYTGMAAMTDVNIRYLPSLFFLSILVAILASEAALWLALKSTEVISSVRFRLKFISAFIMGAAICGMHYTGMAAAIFTPKHNMVNHLSEAVLNPNLLAISIAGVTFLILGIAVLVSTYKESINQQLLLTARQAGMAEVASSVLHNVGNVLNSINVSSLLISEKIKQSRLSTLQGVSQMVEQHKKDFSHFVNDDPQGKHLPDYLQTLSKYWETEQQELSSELQTLVRNVNHVRNIIASQQSLSRVTDVEQVIAIPNVIEEAILISGIDNEKYNIKVDRQYQKLKPVLMDKVKLLQILVNLIQNAKEALLESQKSDKLLLMKLDCDKNEIFISFCDNGIGIENENLVKVFMYGFTTKKSGHGFGLHTSAVLAREMGGKLIVKSEGLNKGATFILTLPYHYQ